MKMKRAMGIYIEGPKATAEDLTRLKQHIKEADTGFELIPHEVKFICAYDPVERKTIYRLDAVEI